MTALPAHLRQVLPAAVVAVALAFGASAVAYPSSATAEPGVWDIEAWDQCAADAKKNNAGDPETYYQLLRICCWDSNGVWDNRSQKCVAPPADPQGSRQLPGNVQIPSDIATAPTVNRVPVPIRVSPGIATAPTVETS